MFLRKCLVARISIYKKILLSDSLNSKKVLKSRSFSGLTSNGQLCSRWNIVVQCNPLLQTNPCSCLLKRQYSKGLIDGDVSQFKEKAHEKELKKILQLFPEPRVILNILTAKTPQKIFEIYYKQHNAPKVSKKKVQNNPDWTCTYAFIWPEKIKFESTALSKRIAADKAATQALHYLYTNRHIDDKGLPVYKQEVLNELRSSLNDPFRANISENSVERIERIWNDYESGIKETYEATFKESRNKILPPPALTKDSTIDHEDACEEENSDQAEDTSETKRRVHPVYCRNIAPPTATTLLKRDNLLQEKFELYDERLTPLPIDEYADEITSTLAKCRVAVIVGAAGCGKSTRAPAAILRRNGAKTTAIVSEPRRVAAIGLAERVASELGEQVGESIGYQVRLRSKPPRPPGGSILYCTSGVLLRRLQSNPGLEGCSHVIIDEAHERDVNTDVTLLLLKRALNINPTLKVIVMSATLDIEVFTNYFDSCPVIEVPGRTFPVEVSYLEDIQKKFNIKLRNTLENCRKEDDKPRIHCQEVVEVIKAVDKTESEGAILVFLPGWAEINLTKQLLDQTFGESSTHWILPVHSRLSTTEQTKMFSKPLPGVRKVVLATNIAETSITIPDVVYVIDTGAHKENRMRESTGTSSLETVWVSLAGANQRTGRAGRVRAGRCYRLYTREKEDDLAPHTMPEILRIPLEQTVLDLKSYAPDDKIEDFLSQLPEPPSKKAIQFAVKDLIDMGALTRTERLTRLGALVSSLALSPRLSLCLLHSYVAGDVPPLCDVTTHCHDNVPLFRDAPNNAPEIREMKRKFSPTSDHAALHWIQDEFERTIAERGWKGVDEWSDKYGLRKDRLNYVKSISSLLLQQLLASGMIEPTVEAEDLNRFSGVDELTAAILLSGSNALLKSKKIVRTKGKLKTVVDLFTSNGDRAHIGGESVNYNITKTSHPVLLTYFGGQHSIERRSFVVYKTSIVTPHTALLFCMGDITSQVSKEDPDVTILSLPKHKLDVHVPARQAEYILKAREMLWNTFKYYIERDLMNLDYDENTRLSRFKVRLIKAIGRILVEAQREVKGNDVNDDFR